MMHWLWLWCVLGTWAILEKQKIILKLMCLVYCDSFYSQIKNISACTAGFWGFGAVVCVGNLGDFGKAKNYFETDVFSVL